MQDKCINFIVLHEKMFYRMTLAVRFKNNSTHQNNAYKSVP